MSRYTDQRGQWQVTPKVSKQAIEGPKRVHRGNVKFEKKLNSTCSLCTPVRISGITSPNTLVYQSSLLVRRITVLVSWPGFICPEKRYNTWIVVFSFFCWWCWMLIFPNPLPVRLQLWKSKRGCFPSLWLLSVPRRIAQDLTWLVQTLSAALLWKAETVEGTERPHLNV